ncbi:MAG: glycosyl hydrolase family 18 protein [Treponema sp.]|nr:glycosyl hydrolase family 18 protein [Treponema sp.]MCL2251947.1 glycosyl hydrolase family 18 protein [Treponema sp.]
MKHYIYVILLFTLVILAGCSSSNTHSVKTESEESKDTSMTDESLSVFIHETGDSLPVTSFREIWGYVVAGEEAPLTANLPITDVGYFGAEVDTYGNLANIPRRQNLSSFKGRVHLVVTCNSLSLTYFTLLPGSPQRAKLIADLIAATKNFDGLNIDFESIPARSAEAYYSFLRELKAGLPDKIFSVALYGRIRATPNEIYNYELISAIADKIFVMAYDEHWSTSKPGPISSLSWCKSVAEYSMRVIGPEKLVMGIPFYGRAWAEQNHHRAYVYAGIERLIRTHNVKEITRENSTPTFNYVAQVPVKVYYEDEYSISARFEMYKSMNVKAIGFWRIGQETPKVWDILKLE